MSTDAIVTMVIGMVAIWGGLAASVAYAVRSHRAATATSASAPAAGSGPGAGDPAAGDPPGRATGDDHEDRA